MILLVAVACAAGAEQATFDSRKAEIRELLGRREYAGALTRAKAINREWPDDVQGYQLVAGASLGIGDYSAAETAIQWMLDLRLGKADATGWLLVARFREVTGDVDGAVDALSQGFTRMESGRDAERAEMAAYAGRLYLLDGKTAFAEQSLKLAGERPDARSTLAEIRVAQDRRDDAIAMLRRLTAETKRPEYLYQLARLTESKADYEVFEAAARARAESSENANRELILYWAGAGARHAEALALAKKEAERRHDVLTLDALAVAYAATGDAERARSTMKQVIGVGTRDPGILAHAAAMGVKPQ